MAKPTISQPTAADEKLLQSVVNNEKSVVVVRNKKFRVGSLYNDTIDWVSNILVKNGDTADTDRATRCKAAAAMALNGFFRLRLFYWFLWRWYFYVRQYTDEELQPLFAEFTKKVSAMWASYCINTISLTDARNTKMQMTREEAEHFRAVLSMAQRGARAQASKEAASSPTLSTQGTSSSDSSRSSAGGTGAV